MNNEYQAIFPSPQRAWLQGQLLYTLCVYPFSIILLFRVVHYVHVHTGGKKCLKCKERLFHDKWNVAPKLAEERWAHQEARKREVAEVAEFLGLD